MVDIGELTATGGRVAGAGDRHHAEPGAGVDVEAARRVARVGDGLRQLVDAGDVGDEPRILPARAAGVGGLRAIGRVERGGGPGRGGERPAPARLSGAPVQREVCAVAFEPDRDAERDVAEAGGRPCGEDVDRAHGGEAVGVLHDDLEDGVGRLVAVDAAGVAAGVGELDAAVADAVGVEVAERRQEVGRGVGGGRRAGARERDRRAARLRPRVGERAVAGGGGGEGDRGGEPRVELIGDGDRRPHGAVEVLRHHDVDRGRARQADRGDDGLRVVARVGEGQLVGADVDAGEREFALGVGGGRRGGPRADGHGDARDGLGAVGGDGAGDAVRERRNDPRVAWSSVLSGRARRPSVTGRPWIAFGTAGSRASKNQDGRGEHRAPARVLEVRHGWFPLARRGRGRPPRGPLARPRPAPNAGNNRGRWPHADRRRARAENCAGDAPFALGLKTRARTDRRARLGDSPAGDREGLAIYRLPPAR